MDEAVFTCAGPFTSCSAVTTLCADSKRYIGSKLGENLLLAISSEEKLSEDIHRELETLLAHLTDQEALFLFIH